MYDVFCYFKGRVKGKKINCEKFLEVFPCYSITDSRYFETEEEYSIIFCGYCKWEICSSANNKEDVEPLRDEDIKKYLVMTVRNLLNID